MPAVMASWYRETSIPRTFCGEISDKYSGTTKFTIPIAKPRIIRPAISQPTEEAKPQRIEPRAKMTAVAIMTFLRPYMSASTPFAAAPITAPTKAELTTQPLARLVSGQVSLMNSRAPEMTPVSKPESSPPSEATAAMT